MIQLKWAVGGIFYKWDPGGYEILTVQIPKFRDPAGEMYENTPGGKVKLRDIRPTCSRTRRATLRRETREELGYAVEIVRAQYLGRKLRRGRGVKSPTLFVFEDYLIEIRGIIVPDRREIHDYRWDSLDDKLGLNLYPSVRELLGKVRDEQLLPAHSAHTRSVTY
jgi:8-oxo-dGTP pyrophosphatase MutT (NUDIX family)